jgi:hypothetical protein
VYPLWTSTATPPPGITAPACLVSGLHSHHQPRHHRIIDCLPAKT